MFVRFLITLLECKGRDTRRTIAENKTASGSARNARIIIRLTPHDAASSGTPREMDIEGTERQLRGRFAIGRADALLDAAERL